MNPLQQPASPQRPVSLSQTPAASDKYWTLVANMQQGFCIIDLLFDERGQPLDYRFLEVNPVFEQLTGLVNVVGQTMRALQPNHEQHWFELYAQVVKTRQPVHVEQQAAHLAGGVWYDVFAFPFGPLESYQVAILFNDTTDRKRQEQSQAFLLQLSDSLRVQPTADAIATYALQGLAEHLQLDRCYIGVYWLAEDRGEFIHQVGNDRVPPVPDQVRLSDFPDALRVAFERTLVIDDVDKTVGLTETDRQNLGALGFSALIASTLRQGERSPLWSIVAVSSQPRRWRLADIKLIDEVTERTWAALERAKAEAALQTSEQFVQGVIRSLPLVIYLFDLVQRRNRYLSPQVAQLFGYSADQMQAADQLLIATFFHPDDWARLAAHFAHIRAQPPGADDHAPVFAIDYRINHPQRGWVWVQSRDTVYARDAAGSPTLVLGTAEDISERRAAGEAVAESEKRLRLIVEATQLATWEWDLATDQLLWNEQYFQLLGMPPQANPLPAETFFRHLHADDAPSIRSQLQQTSQQRVPYDAEFRIVREDGLIRWMYGHGRVTAEADGHPVRVSGVMLDITERKATQASLQQSEEALAELRHLTLLSQTEALAQIGSWEYHRASGQFSWSAGMYAVTEVDPQRTLVPEIYAELAIEADQAQARSLIHFLRTGLGHFEGPLQIRVRDTVKTLRIKADVIGTGEATRVVGVDMDISGQLLAQQRLRETADSLQAVLDGSPASIGLLKAQRDERGHAVDFRLGVGNDKLARFLGESLPALLGQPARRFSSLLWDDQTLDWTCYI